MLECNHETTMAWKRKKKFNIQEILAKKNIWKTFSLTNPYARVFDEWIELSEPAWMLMLNTDTLMWVFHCSSFHCIRLFSTCIKWSKQIDFFFFWFFCLALLPLFWSCLSLWKHLDSTGMCSSVFTVNSVWNQHVISINAILLLNGIIFSIFKIKS